MPALAKSPVHIPRFKPHARAGDNGRSDAFSGREPAFTTSAAAQRSQSGEKSYGLILDRLAHDARNVLAGLRLYCDLLATPGVLTPEHCHYAPELAGIAEAATRIVERILTRATTVSEALPQIPAPHPLPASAPAPFAPAPVADAAAELRRLRPLLAAIAGSSVRLSVDTMPCPGLTALSVEDLTRVLVNLVRNAADAMPAGGRVRVTAQYGDGLSFLTALNVAHAEKTTSAPRTVLVTVADNGPGISAVLREQVFDAGFTTRDHAECPAIGRDWLTPRRRGLGLNIVRSLVEAAGGAVRIAPEAACGARFEIILPILNAEAPGGPITSGTCLGVSHNMFSADSPMKGCIECQ